MSEPVVALIERRVLYRHGLTAGVAGCPPGAILLTRKRRHKANGTASEKNGTSCKDPTRPAPGTELCEDEAIEKLMKWKVTKGVDTGLENRSVTCYINASLQCLAHTAPLANYLSTYKSNHKGAGVDWLLLLSNITKHSTNPSRKRSVIHPTEFSVNLRRLSSTFRKGRLEDAQEFTSFLLDACHMCQLRVYGDKKDPLVQETTPIRKIFGGFYLSKVSWNKEEELQLLSQKKNSKISNDVRVSDPMSATYEPFTILALELVGGDVYRCLQNFTKSEPLDGDNKYLTPSGVKVSASKRLTVFRGPRILTLHLKRFISNMWGETRKHNKFVSFPLELDMNQYSSSPTGSGDNLIYDLYAVLVHLGRGLQTGHYISFVKASNGMWYILDDESVRQISESDVLKQNAYLLCYQRRENVTPVKAQSQKDQNGVVLSKRQRILEEKRKADVGVDSTSNSIKRPKPAEKSNGVMNVNSPQPSLNVSQNGISNGEAEKSAPPKSPNNQPDVALKKKKVAGAKKVVKKIIKKSKKKPRYESALLNQSTAFEMPDDKEKYWADVHKEIAEEMNGNKNGASDSEDGAVGQQFQTDIRNSAPVEETPAPPPSQSQPQPQNTTTAKDPILRATQEVSSHRASAHLVATASSKNMTWDGIDHGARNELLRKQNHVRKKTVKEIVCHFIYIFQSQESSIHQNCVFIFNHIHHKIK